MRGLPQLRVRVGIMQWQPANRICSRGTMAGRKTAASKMAGRKAAREKAAREKAAAMDGELEFLRQLQRDLPVMSPVTTGIGDDGAVLESAAGAEVVVTDLLLDGTHFVLKETSAELIGRKAMAVNLSDLAAMGAAPTAAFVSLALPRVLPPALNHECFLRRLYQGMRECAEQWGFTIAGGDTNVWDGQLAINVCLLGRPFTDRIPLRSHGRAGDRVLVTGQLGGSLASGRHLSFEPRLEFARWLLANYPVHAMMDLSDGLATDLPRILEASQCGGEVYCASIPIHSDVPQQLSDDDRLRAALCDGEDFELLLTVSEEAATQLLRADVPCPVTEIGRLTGAPGLRYLDVEGRPIAASVSGWEHRF